MVSHASWNNCEMLIMVYRICLFLQTQFDSLCFSHRGSLCLQSGTSFLSQGLCRGCSPHPEYFSFSHSLPLSLHILQQVVCMTLPDHLVQVRAPLLISAHPFTFPYCSHYNLCNSLHKSLPEDAVNCYRAGTLFNSLASPQTLAEYLAHSSY